MILYLESAEMTIVLTIITEYAIILLSNIENKRGCKDDIRRVRDTNSTAY